MDIDKIIREQINNVMDTEQLDSLSAYADQLSNGLSENFTFNQILERTLEGKSIFNSEETIDSLKDLFFLEIKAALIVGVEIIVICIIIGLLNNLSGSFGEKSISEISTLVCTTVIIGLILTNFNDIYDLTLSSIKTITYTMEILLPILLGLLISMGKIASGTIMNPLLLTSITIFESIIKNFILPAIFLSTMLNLINGLTEKDYVNLLSKFIRNAALFATGIILTLMSGIVAIQGLVVKTSDNLILGMAKYSLDSFIPIVGGFTADTVELFMKCMGSIKNVVGVFGIITIILLILSPIIRILAVAMVYKITALLVEPVATKKLSKTITELGTSLITMGAILFFSSLLFIIFITSIINLGGS